MGGNAVIRRATLERVLPYPERLGKIGNKIRSGEDEVIYHRLLDIGARGIVLPDLIITHWIPAERMTRATFEDGSPGGESRLAGNSAKEDSKSLDCWESEVSVRRLLPGALANADREVAERTLYGPTYCPRLLCNALRPSLLLSLEFGLLNLLSRTSNLVQVM